MGRRGRIRGFAPRSQEWTYRFLAAAREEVRMGTPTDSAISDLAAHNPAPVDPSPHAIRAWAREHGCNVSAKGRIPAGVRRAYEAGS